MPLVLLQRESLQPDALVELTRVVGRSFTFEPTETTIPTAARIKQADRDEGESASLSVEEPDFRVLCVACYRSGIRRSSTGKDSLDPTSTCSKEAWEGLSR